MITHWLQRTINRWLPIPENVSEEPAHFTDAAEENAVWRLPEVDRNLKPLVSEQKFFVALLGEDVKNEAKFSDIEKRLLLNAQSALKREQERSHNIPHQPTIIPQLLKKLRNPKSTTQQLIRLIRQDPALAAMVLKTANSPFYRHSKKGVDSIERSVLTLGFNGVYSIVSRVAMQPIINCQSEDYKNFGQLLWGHSLYCAQSCQLLAQYSRHDSFKAYLLGLVHDMGKLMVFVQLLREHKQAGEAAPNAAALRWMMEQKANRLSYQIAKDWKFPPDLVKALKEQVNASQSQSMSPLGKILFCSNIAAEAAMLHQQGEWQQAQLLQLLHDINLPSDWHEQVSQRLAVVESA